ncbi:hypothetical protein BDZ89DRAFT_1073929 [Hymenopellis radicata]|nr:hypothetical protein BDZ89DRAFT_1073929 [Hymenopellis radicata]
MALILNIRAHRPDFDGGRRSAGRSMIVSIPGHTALAFSIIYIDSPHDALSPPPFVQSRAHD